MTHKEYKRKIADARRSAGRKYGFRQSSYINFKVENGYFFCICFLTGEARLTVKPMYADDLWWEIWEADENKNEPLSLRGTGAYSLPGEILASYEVPATDDVQELTDIFNQLFQAADTAITEFLSGNPDADIFCPDESKMDHDPDRLLYLMTLIHNGRTGEALTIVREARKNGHRCMFQSGMFSDSYTYIRRWSKGESVIRRLRKSALKYLTRSASSENSGRISRGVVAGKRRRKPWYRRLTEWAYWVFIAPIYISLLFYFFNLHRRTLYDVDWWIWFLGGVLFILFFLFRTVKDGQKGREMLFGILLSVTGGLVSGLIAVGAGIGLFDGVNRLFASEPLEVTAVVTDIRFRHIGRGRGDLSQYITVVELPSENRIMRIDDAALYNVAPQSRVVITYRRGLFGIDIFDSFCYPD